MHGIIRERQTERPDHENMAVREVALRYADGRTATFVPDADRETFNHDDMMELVRVFERASATAEWAEAAEDRQARR